MRYVLEGEWSGYKSSQRRICYRVVTTRPKLYSKLKTIRFADGTILNLKIRPCLKREKIKEKNGYSFLIFEALALNKEYVTVDELN